MTKSFNKQFNKPEITLYQGEIYVTRKAEILKTILGSCIAICLYNTESDLVGMNHYALPQRKTNIYKHDLNYGKESIDVLVKRMVNKGCKLTNIKAKVFGGAAIADNTSINVGYDNIQLAFKILKEYKIPIESKDVNGRFGRVILFDVISKSVYVKELK